MGVDAGRVFSGIVLNDDSWVACARHTLRMCDMEKACAFLLDLIDSENVVGIAFGSMKSKRKNQSYQDMRLDTLLSHLNGNPGFRKLSYCIIDERDMTQVALAHMGKTKMKSKRKNQSYQDMRLDTLLSHLNGNPGFRKLSYCIIDERDTTQIADMEISSLKQKLKIEELEARLNEAKDVVTDLRAQLNAVQDELEKLEKTRLKPLDERTSKNLASIILESKEPELYRNRYTQRSRAFERDLPDGKSPLLMQTEDQESNLKTGPTTKEDIIAEVTCVVAPPREFDVRITEKKADVMEDEHEGVKPSRMLSSRISTQNRKAVVVLVLTMACKAVIYLIFGTFIHVQAIAWPSIEKVLIYQKVLIGGVETRNTSSEANIQPASDRLIKLTFQRKRKKGSLSDPDENEYQ
ncbi:hypothetical protein IFM89_011402 [Coptis chinensis]|uniref:Uncharacterized protein n=1 Tax=Coptis chinensis TaxID=261450 RepID=A0A835LMR8_9MAGN|nr:hypothetical protein IFM89_011402 [Coptis chinensis]